MQTLISTRKSPCAEFNARNRLQMSLIKEMCYLKFNLKKGIKCSQFRSQMYFSKLRDISGKYGINLYKDMSKGFILPQYMIVSCSFQNN